MIEWLKRKGIPTTKRMMINGAAFTILVLICIIGAMSIIFAEATDRLDRWLQRLDQ